MSRNEIWVFVLHEFVGFDLKVRNDGEKKDAKGFVVWPAHVDTSKVTVILLWTEKSGGKHLQKPFADTYGRILYLAMEQNVENFGWFMEYWDGEKVVSRGGGQQTNIVLVPSAGDA